MDNAAELLDAERALLLLTDDAGLLAVRASCGFDPDAVRRSREPSTRPSRDGCMR